MIGEREKNKRNIKRKLLELPNNLDISCFQGLSLPSLCSYLWWNQSSPLSEPVTSALMQQKYLYSELISIVCILIYLNIVKNIRGIIIPIIPVTHEEVQATFTLQLCDRLIHEYDVSLIRDWLFLIFSVKCLRGLT